MQNCKKEGEKIATASLTCSSGSVFGWGKGWIIYE